MRELKRRLEGGFRNHKRHMNKKRVKKIDVLVDEISERSHDYLDNLKEQIHDNKMKEQSPLSFIIQKSRYGSSHSREQPSKPSSLNAVLMTNSKQGVYRGVGNTTGCLACRRRLYDPI